MLDVGRVCVKTAGREAGRYCVIVNIIDDNFVMVTGPNHLTKVKRRRCNILHLKPVDEKVKIKPDSSDADILKEYTKANLFSRLKLEKPVPVKGPEFPEAGKPDIKVEEKAKSEAGGLRARFRLRRKAEVKKPEKPKAKKAEVEPKKAEKKTEKPKAVKPAAKKKAAKAKKK